MELRLAIIKELLISTNKAKKRKNAKKKLLQKKLKKHILRSFQRSVFKSNEQIGDCTQKHYVKKPNFQWELIKIDECILKRHDAYDNNLVSYSKSHFEIFFCFF